MPTVAITLETTIRDSLEHVFDFTVAEDVLPKVLLGYGPLLPAVTSTSDRHGRWDQPGSYRTVHLADGNTSREEVTDYQRPSYFAYKVSNFTVALRYLATKGQGQWWYRSTSEGTSVRWTYTFTSRSVVTYPLLWVFAHWLWRGYMRVCLKATHRHLEHPEQFVSSQPV